MLISTKGRYALRVMIYLARHGQDGYLSLKAITAQEGISVKYVEAIIAILKKAGYVEGVRGKGGGYRLTRSPQEYTVDGILRLTEGTLAPVACLERGALPCGRAADCPTLPMWKQLDALIADFLSGVTLADLAGAPAIGPQD